MFWKEASLLSLDKDLEVVTSIVSCHTSWECHFLVPLPSLHPEEMHLNRVAIVLQEKESMNAWKSNKASEMSASHKKEQEVGYPSSQNPRYKSYSQQDQPSFPPLIVHDSQVWVGLKVCLYSPKTYRQREFCFPFSNLWMAYCMTRC